MSLIDPVLCMTFSQDEEYFSVGLENGFRIYHLYPLQEKISRSLSGGIGHIAMMFQSNYLALVGGGRSPYRDPTKLMLWDDAIQQVVVQITLSSVIKAVKLRMDHIIVALAHHIHVYTVAKNPQLLHVFDTSDNELGCLSLCYSDQCALMAFPGKQRGHVQLTDLLDPSRTMLPIIPAHENTISSLILNHNGSLVATASEKGTLIRVYDTAHGKLLHEFRRGTDQAMIYSLAFSKDSKRLILSSDKGTLHMFNIESLSRKEGHGLESSNLSLLKDYLPKYFSSNWSFAHIKIPECHSICCFADPFKLKMSCSALSPLSVFAVYANGQIHHYIFEPSKGGEGIVESNMCYLSCLK